MHELAVTENILATALAHAARAGATQVTDLYLVVGELSSFVPDSIQFYWDIISRDTRAAGARLHVEREAARLACATCGASYAPADGLVCPDCGGRQVEVVAGEAFYLAAIDVAAVSAADGRE